MIAIIDYNSGNLFNVSKAFKSFGVDTVITKDEKDIRNASGIILPGVGAFGDAMQNLKMNGLDEIIKSEAKSGKNLLGICLGMQLLFDSGSEGGNTEGLSLIGGSVDKIETTLKIPHMGWNKLKFHTESPLFDGVCEGSYVYFVHSYHAKLKDKSNLIAYCDYGVGVTGAVQKDNVFGMQYHPEKSSDVGIKMLENFAKICKTGRIL